MGSVLFIISSYWIILFPYLGFLSKTLTADGVCDIPEN